MTDRIQIGHPTPDEIPVLEALWMETFGDPPELVEAFFDQFPPQLHGWVVRLRGEIVSSAYLLHGNLLIRDGSLCAAPYVYAVATPKEHRGNGYAGRLMQFFCQTAQERQMQLYTRPASESLFHWYARVMQTVPAMPLAPIRVPAENRGIDLTQLSPAAYGEKREAILQRRSHIALSSEFLKVQEVFLQAEDGGYYDFGTGICAVEKHEDTIWLKEFLCRTESAESLGGGIAAALHAKQAQLWIASEHGAPHVAYSGSLAADPVEWGLLLD